MGMTPPEGQVAVEIGRREFVATLGGAALAWPHALHAQKVERVSRVGVLIPYLETDAEAQAQMAAFRDGLEKLGLAPGHSVQIDERWIAGDFGMLRRAAKELVILRPDVIISRSTAATAALLYETRTKPVVFLLISDPVGDGFVVSMARPGGHATGFADAPASIAGKWLDLLKEMAPRTNRVAVMYGTGTAPGDGLYYLRPIQAEAHSRHLKAIGIRVKNLGEIEQDIRETAREPDGALIVTPDLTTTLYRDGIIRAALQYRVPAMYPFRYVTAEGGLISYGVDVADQYRHAADYVDRILKGAKPRELPVQAPTKFELAVNLKTAKALGLDVPPTLLARADEVLE
jgi:putative tryptophan/tyrosine transport system substrate-binding protein